MGPIEAATRAEAEARRKRLWNPPPPAAKVQQSNEGPVYGQIVQWPVNVRRIMLAVVEGTDFSVDDLISKSKATALVRMRMLTVCIAQRLTDNSQKKIAAHMNRDHTTICHTAQRAEETFRDDPDFAAAVVALERKLAGAVA